MGEEGKNNMLGSRSVLGVQESRFKNSSIVSPECTRSSRIQV